MITKATADDVYEFTMTAGDNFIVLEGNDFTGSLSLLNRYDVLHLLAVATLLH